MSASSKFFFEETQSDEPEISLFEPEPPKPTKRHEKLVENAIRDKNYESISTLFSEHPLYTNLTVERKHQRLVASYKIYSVCSKTWNIYHTVSEANDSSIYKRIGEAIENLSNPEPKPTLPGKSPADKFFLE